MYSTRLSLRRNFSWTLSGTLIYAGSQWLILVALARLGSPEMVGQFAFGLALTAPVFMFTNLQLRAVQATDASGDFQFSEYLALRLLMSGVAFLVVIVIAVIFLDWGSIAFWTTILLGLAKAVESISDITYGALQRVERMDRIARSMALKGILSLGAVVSIVYVTGSLVLAVASLFAMWSAVFLLLDIRNSRRLQLCLPEGGLRVARLRALARLALPLGIVMMLVSLNASVPKYALEFYFSAHELGIFAALAYLVVAGGTIVTSLGQSASPRLANYRAAGDVGRFWNLLAKLVTIGIAIGFAGLAGAYLLGEYFLYLLYGPEYAVHNGILMWLMLGALFSYIGAFFGYSMTVLRSFNRQVAILLVTLAVVVTGALVLTPAYGLTGAALVFVLAAGVQMILKMTATIIDLRRLGRQSNGSAEVT